MILLPLTSYLGLLACWPAEAALSGTSPFPRPPRQSKTQQAVLLHHSVEAQRASAAAVGELLSFFAQAEFRRGLEECCPEVAALAPGELLARFQDEVAAAELAHNFPAESEDSAFLFDETLTLLENYTFFTNQWQAALIEKKTNSSGGKEIGSLLNIPEEGVFACPPFTNRSSPTWTETSGRFVYAAHNIWQISTGSSPTFGNITVVFKTSAVEDLVVLAPVDTGLWYSSCDRKAGFTDPPDYHYNCSGWVPQTLGTLSFHNHLIVANWVLLSGHRKRTLMAEALAFFAHSAFAANYSQQPPEHVDNTYNYWEAAILGSPRVPEDLKFFIPQFQGELFGAAKGERLLSLSRRFALPLVWAFGALPDKEESKERMPDNVRLLDPRTAVSAGLNATLPRGALAHFEQLWAHVAAVRKERQPTSAELLAWWKELKAQQLWVAPLTARACSKSGWDACIGIDVTTRDCICRSASDVIAI